MPTSHLDLPLAHAGKVRELYATDRDDQLLLVATDSISAFDRVLPTPVPDKGAVLTQLSTWWLGQLADVVPNHLVSSQVPPPVAGRAVVVERLEMVPVECVVRGYLAGSAWKEYRETGLVAGMELPRQLLQGERLERPLFTPARKASQGEHDESITYAQLAHSVGPDLARQLWLASMKLYVRAERIARSRGLILVDTKFEFGRRADGTLVLADEVLTPDSSRYWSVADYRPGQEMPALDKQLLRDWLATESGWDPDSGQPAPELPAALVAALRDRYTDLFRRLTGYDMTPAEPWVARAAAGQAASAAPPAGASAVSDQPGDDLAESATPAPEAQGVGAHLDPAQGEFASGPGTQGGLVPPAPDPALSGAGAPDETPGGPGAGAVGPPVDPTLADEPATSGPEPATKSEAGPLTGGAEIEQAHAEARAAADLLDTDLTVGLGGGAAGPGAETLPAPAAGEAISQDQLVPGQVAGAGQVAQQGPEAAGEPLGGPEVGEPAAYETADGPLEAVTQEVVRAEGLEGLIDGEPAAAEPEPGPAAGAPELEGSPGQGVPTSGAAVVAPPPDADLVAGAGADEDAAYGAAALPPAEGLAPTGEVLPVAAEAPATAEGAGELPGAAGVPVVGPGAAEEPAGAEAAAGADVAEAAGADHPYQVAAGPAGAEGSVADETRTGPAEPDARYDHRATQEAGVAHDSSGPTTTLVVEVMPKPEILDPQGKAVTGALRRLGFGGLSVRQGKRFEVVVDGELSDDLLQQVRQAAETLLANTVIEDFRVVVPEEQGQA